MQVGRNNSCKDALSDALGGTQLGWEWKGWHAARTLSLSGFKIHGIIALFMTTIKNLQRDSAVRCDGCGSFLMDSCPKVFKLIWGQPSSPYHLRLMIGEISRSAMT